MNAITLDKVGKRFRRVTLRREYTTFKSALVGLFSGAPGGGPGQFSALTDISFAIPAGQTWGIIGRNGSGKSTLLKILAGIYRPDHGAVKVEGRVSALLELGAGFHPEFSGRENIYLNGSILGMPRAVIRAKFDEIVAFAGLEEFIDNPVRTYSSGMFMRLGFSVAIHSGPDVLLVDEVLAVGDQSFALKCKEKINSFKRAGKTIVVVTHDMGDVERLCDTAVWLEHGRLMEIGPPAPVIDRYLGAVAESDNQNMLQSAAPSNGERIRRWGDRRAEITRVVMRGGDGQERAVFPSGAGLTVEVEYLAHTPLEAPVFGVGIHKSDGAQCYGVNTLLENIPIARIEGAGRVALRFDRLDLVEDSYTLSVAIHAKDGHAYDYHDQMYPFSIRSHVKDVGVYRPPHQWIIDGRAVAAGEAP
ncbi:MAG: ABC transporter ATP-binding protein [Nitrospinae bacterium]|nr:ABC transporter ATP-binding protein [Nitrospinota bacterium]